MLVRVYTNDTRVHRVVVQIVQLCSVWCRVRFVGVPCLRPATAPARELACSRFAVSVFHVGLESVSVCLWYVICKRNARQSDDAHPRDASLRYLAHLVDYVYDSPQRLAHRLSCSRFCARWSNCVTADHPTATRLA